MNVLAISPLFPSDANPVKGIFLANFLNRLAGESAAVQVVNPLAYLPDILLRLPRFSSRRGIRRHQWWNRIEVFRPSYLSLAAKKRLWFQARSFCRSALPLCERLHQQRPFDLVLGHGLLMAGHAAQAIAKHLGLRSVSWAIGDDVHTRPLQSAENLRLLRHCVQHNDFVITVCRKLQQQVLALCPGARNVHPFYRGIEFAPLRDAPVRKSLRQTLGLDPDRVYMISLGDADTTKGTAEFYEAFRVLASRWERLSAIWVGDGRQRDSLLAQAQADGLARRFSLTGWLDRPRALAHTLAADLLVFPSHIEGLSNSIVEALGAGLPVVVTDTGGAEETVAHGISGLVVPPRDVSSLTQAIEHLLAHPDQARTMGLRGQQFVRQYFDLDRNAPVAASLFRQIAEGLPNDRPLPACADVLPGQLPIECLKETYRHEIAS